MEHIEELRKYIAENLPKKNDYSFIDPSVFGEIVSELVLSEAKYVDSLKKDQNGDVEYDDDKAFECIAANIKTRFSDYTMFVQAIVDDYLDLSEAFLTESGDIEWV